MQKPLLDENDEKIVSISRRSKTVSTSNQYARMSVIADTLASCLASINCRLVLLAVTVPSECLRRSKPAAPRLLCLKLTQLGVVIERIAIIKTVVMSYGGRYATLVDPRRLPLFYSEWT